LGKQSGFKKDKIKWLNKHNLLTPFNGYYIFKDCAAAMLIDVKESIVTGDHTCFIGHVKQHINISADEILTTEYLRVRGIIR
jgi:flavin reductase (DIM6/NTAB) family NADH-FMN oxidoreductase RutF